MDRGVQPVMAELAAEPRSVSAPQLLRLPAVDSGTGNNATSPLGWIGRRCMQAEESDNLGGKHFKDLASCGSET